MELLNVGFVILVIKIAICVLPGVFGIFLLSANEEKKRAMRNLLCGKLFGVSNAIPYPNFARTLLVVGLLLVLFSAGASWFLLLSDIILPES